MKTQLATGFVVLGLALAPVAMANDKAADSGAPSKTAKMTEKVKTAAEDATITTKIKAEYAKDKTVSALKIHVDTDPKGVVTLSGNAKSQAEIDKAVDIAKNVKGVTEVKN